MSCLPCIDLIIVEVVHGMKHDYFMCCEFEAYSLECLYHNHPLKNWPCLSQVVEVKKYSETMVWTVPDITFKLFEFVMTS
ncbi:Glycerol-1-phosphate dehydrogenase [NAD(P)+] [Frankliniella fusca]|uniref:Glycerol-1-phosphate dehydrogenase [NAD(P)+] n=1 Tax=Frankliniella fusca TaxID=407009 RepID=A0AAE1L9Q0_9NEOP|nr:Glycerol-1-phosphate dehydrogenase [NAD(P)+] [Frankliniella fusca]